MKQQITLLMLITFTPFLLIAQTYTEWIGNGWGLGMDECHPAIHDIDSDGLLDLFVGTYNGDIHHFEQTAVNSNSFLLKKYHFNHIDVGLYAAPVLTDIDRDGMLDLIVGNYEGYLYHYEQISTNADSFLLISDNFSGIKVYANSAPCITDLDQDELLDLLIGTHMGDLLLYEQEGTGSTDCTLITDSVKVNPPTIRINPAITDLDHNGLLDLIIGGNFGDLSHYEQESTGSIEFTLHNLHLFENYEYIYGASAPCFVDLDKDGLLDLLIGEMDGLYYHFEQIAMDAVDFTVQSTNILNSMDVGSGAAPNITDLVSLRVVLLTMSSYAVSTTEKCVSLTPSAHSKGANNGNNESGSLHQIWSPRSFKDRTVQQANSRG